jgi:molecular chaperone GrpE
MSDEKDINQQEEITEEVEKNPEDVIEQTASDESIPSDEEISEYNDTASKIDEIESALEETKDKYLRLMAEYDNYRKRTAKEKTETYNNAVSDSITEILPVIDTFEMALKTECSDERFKTGVEKIYNMFRKSLEKLGVTEIEALGKEFDPNLHNAIKQVEETDYAENYVCEVFQKGYRLGKKVIRHSMVAVAI